MVTESFSDYVESRTNQTRINMNRTALFLSILLLGTLVSSCEHRERGLPLLESQFSGTDQLLIGLSPVNERVVWTSGMGGTVLRTVDGRRSRG
jgi:hypothetical protein